MVKIICHIAMEIKFHMMRLKYMSILLYSLPKYQKIHQISGTFHFNVRKELGNKSIILGDLMESSNNKILLGSEHGTTLG